jgi:hypothetical protein
MKRRIVCAVPLAGRAGAVAAALVLVVPVTARCAETGGWIFDTAAGCKVWNPHPQPNETIRWSGACANGMAQGRGAAQWFRGNLPFESDEGEWREGRQAGYGTQVWPTGRYDGELVDGEPNGRGTLIVQGLRYEGELRNGKPNGPDMNRVVTLATALLVLGIVAFPTAASSWGTIREPNFSPLPISIASGSNQAARECQLKRQVAPALRVAGDRFS